MKRGISLLGTAALVLPVCVTMSAVLLAPRQLRADDLKLKDGSKISGTIVGFEENSFKVKTSYGFAVVQKDQVVSIAMSDAPKVAAERSPEPAAEKTSPAEKPKSESVKAASAPPLPAMAGATAEPVAKAAPPAVANQNRKDCFACAGSWSGCKNGHASRGTGRQIDAAGCSGSSRCKRRAAQATRAGADSRIRQRQHLHE